MINNYFYGFLWITSGSFCGSLLHLTCKDFYQIYINKTRRRSSDLTLPNLLNYGLLYGGLLGASRWYVGGPLVILLKYPYISRKYI